jgi:hypothetical protein
MDNSKESLMHHRDGDPNQVRIVRDIPLWGILCVLGVGVGQAVLMWSSQREQATAIAALTAQVRDANTNIINLTAQVGTTNNKNLELSFEVSGLKSRVDRLETGRK